jgi:hypothetical protein
VIGLLRSSLGGRSSRSAKLTETDRQVKVSRYFEDYVDGGKPGYIYVVRHPFKSLSVLIALFQLPCLHVAPRSAGAEGAAIRALLSPRATALLSPRSMLTRATGFATAALQLPLEPGQYSLGASKQTLRRKVRRARMLGVRWAEVSDPQERLDLLKHAEESERTHPDPRYRNPDPDIRSLLSYRLWLAAYSAEGTPVLLSVTPVDGELAALGYFRTVGSGKEQSNARYLMTEVLIEHLVEREVRYLLDGGGLAIPNGIRHFQRMLGFRIYRTRMVRAGRGRACSHVGDDSGSVDSGAGLR